jgi:hypothetical protein
LKAERKTPDCYKAERFKFNLRPVEKSRMMESATNHHIDVIEGSRDSETITALFVCLKRLKNI